MKSDYQYSAEIVYNNFPWPNAPNAKQKIAAEDAASEVFAARRKFKKSTLATLYDPVTMPPDLSKAHANLDRAVEKCYRTARFISDRERVEHLFTMYAALSAPLTENAVASRNNRPSSSKIRA